MRRRGGFRGRGEVNSDVPPEAMDAGLPMFPNPAIDAHRVHANQIREFLHRQKVLGSHAVTIVLTMERLLEKLKARLDRETALKAKGVAILTPSSRAPRRTSTDSADRSVRHTTSRRSAPATNSPAPAPADPTDESNDR